MNITSTIKIVRPGRISAKSFLSYALTGICWVVLNISICTASEPNRADIAKIYNIERAAGQNVDVRYYRKGECEANPDKWCVIKAEGGYLNPKDFLQTGEISRADLALVNTREQYNEILFWQLEGSRSKFLPKTGTCHFEVGTGGFLYAHPHQSVNPGCEKIVGKHASIFPRGTVLFISGGENETLVGVLSSQKGRPVIVNAGNQDFPVEAGYYISSKANGDITRGSFDLEEFYLNNPLVTGLGSAKKDDQYVARQEPAIRLILEKLREETQKAAIEQKKLIADGNPNDVNMPSGVQPPPDSAGSPAQPPAPDVVDTASTTGTATSNPPISYDSTLFTGVVIPQPVPASTQIP